MLITAESYRKLRTESYRNKSYGNITFAVARIRALGEILHIFPYGTQSMRDRGSKKAYTGPRTGVPANQIWL